MSNIITTTSADLNQYLSTKDSAFLAELSRIYDTIDSKNQTDLHTKTTEMSDMMQDYLKGSNIHVYGFETAHESHSEASRIIAKLRNPSTYHDEFLYFTQRAYETVFKLMYVVGNQTKRLFTVPTPVMKPTPQFAVHKTVSVEDKVNNSVSCVLLRGALLPAMVLSKEIEEYSDSGYVTPFSLFRIKRNEEKSEADMEYDLYLDESYFKLEELHGKDLIFADPMNATGGSLIAVMKYLRGRGVEPKSVKFVNVIATMKGALRIVAAIPNCEVYTLWADPIMNAQGYLLPGLGDAGDRLNGVDGTFKRGITQLIADYGSHVVGLYRSQVREIEGIMKRARGRS